MTGESSDRSDSGPLSKRSGWRTAGVVAVFVGTGWIVRIATSGPTVTDGILFELLPPLALIYVGVVAFGK